MENGTIDGTRSFDRDGVDCATLQNTINFCALVVSDSPQVQPPKENRTNYLLHANSD